MTSEGRFEHHLNADGTIDCICLRCFRTVAIAESVQRLTEHEECHQCADDHLLKAREEYRRQSRGEVVEWPKKGHRECGSNLVEWPCSGQTSVA